MTEQNAINHVANRAAENQAERYCSDPVIVLEIAQPVQDDAADDDGNNREEPALPAAGTGEKAEGGAGVVGQVPVKLREDGHRITQRQQILGNLFGDLIERDDQHAQPEPAQRSRRQGHQ